MTSGGHRTRGAGQFEAVRALLDAAETPLTPEEVARAFTGRLSPRRQARVQEVLTVLADLSIAREAQDASLFTSRR